MANKAWNWSAFWKLPPNRLKEAVLPSIFQGRKTAMAGCHRFLNRPYAYQTWESNRKRIPDRPAETRGLSFKRVRDDLLQIRPYEPFSAAVSTDCSGCQIGEECP